MCGSHISVLNQSHGIKPLAASWDRRQSRKNQLAPSPAPINFPPQSISTPPDPRPPAPPQTIPCRRIRTHESPRDVRVAQAPAGAINREQIMAAVSGRDCGWQDLQRTGNCPAQRPVARGAGRLTESHTRKPESELAEKLLKVEKATQNAAIKEIMADFGLEGVTKKRLSRYHRR